MRRNIFIDAGANKGQSVGNLRELEIYDESFEIFSFEPIPRFINYCRKKFEDDPQVELIEKAVWLHDGHIEIFEDLKRRGLGSTILKEKTSGKFDREHPLRVECVDFGKWIKDNFAKDDYIILKMDIEGAEYQVLPRMMEDGSIEYVDDAYIEFHWKRLTNVSKEDHIELENQLRAIPTLTLHKELYVSLGKRR